jgi:hypothetical protein
MEQLPSPEAAGTAVRDETSQRLIGDPQRTLEMLEEALPRFRQASDLGGLMRVREQALAIAGDSERGVRKRAQRVAKRADAGIQELRRSGAETDEEREAREAREEREARWQAREAEGRLLELMLVSLRLLLVDDTGSPDAVTAFRSLASLEDDGDLRDVVAGVFESRSPLLVSGFDRSRRIFAEIGTGTLLGERQEIERLLKFSAVELLTNGADVRGLRTNTIPLVAYSLFRGNLPVAPEAASPATVEKINNLLLGVADELGEASTDARLLVVSLFRLAVLLGEAQEYAEKLSLTSLSM